MKNRKGIIWAPILIIIATVVVAGVAGYFLFKAGNTNNIENNNVNLAVTNQANSNASTNTNVATNTNTSITSNVFSYKTGRVGDHVARMVITKIGLFKADQPSIEPNAHVEFSGQATVSGTVTSRFSEFAGQNYVCLDKLDQASVLLIPKAVEDTRSIHFCFTNTEVALKSFPLGTNKSATVTLDSYAINDYPSEVLNLATFVSTDPTASWKTYTNPAHSYSIKYPNDWTISENNERITFTGAGTGTPFTAPYVSISTSEPDPQTQCLIKETTVRVLGDDRLRQTQGCSYAGSNIVTFFKRGTSYIAVQWTEDVPPSYQTYELVLSTLQFTN